jgi:predicted metalloprotease
MFRVSSTGGDRAHPFARAWTLIASLCVVTVLTGCGQPSAPRPPDAAVAGAADPAPDRPPTPVTGGSGSADDRYASAVAQGVERYWRTEFPARFGREWRDLRGFLAADPGESGAPAPCLARSLDLTNQALYCPREDTVVWDRTHLVPELREDYGDAGVVVALAHEIGHAVHARLGVDLDAQQRDPDRYPTILLEHVADCFAGATVRAVADGRIAGLRTDAAGVDGALRALLSFRDPVGQASVKVAHGNAFDRASAFLSGYDTGTATCAGMTVAGTRFTERPYRSAVDESRGGNLDLGALLARLQPDAGRWFAGLAVERGHQWAGVRLVSGERCAGSCPGALTVDASQEQIAAAYRNYGDYAGATVLASRYALAALAAMGRPVVGPTAGRTALCLTGAYTDTLLTRRGGFGLSPGDLDEAVDELVGDDVAARDADGHAPDGDRGLDRVRWFRAGLLGGPDGCAI